MRNHRSKYQDKYKRDYRNKYRQYSDYVKHPPAGMDREEWSKLLAQELGI